MLAFGKNLILHTKGKDKYNRTLADVLLPDGMNLNQELVKQGWCWWYRKYAPADMVLEGLERVARGGRKGRAHRVRGSGDAGGKPIACADWCRARCAPGADARSRGTLGVLLEGVGAWPG